MPAASTERTIIVGVIGHSPVVEAFPLGPDLMRRLEARLAGVAGARAENMTWGPIHIVQRFQDADEPRPTRMVLIGAAAVSRQPGRVAAFHWKGGDLSDTAVQERVYEAVTGVVDLENTLMIGERFGIWPQECYTVEADIPADAFGAMVIAESDGRSDDATLRALLRFSPAGMIDEIVELAGDLAETGRAAQSRTSSKCARDLVPTGGFMHNRVVAV